MVGWRSVRWLLGCYEAAGGVDCFSEHFHVCLLNSRSYGGFHTPPPFKGWAPSFITMILQLCRFNYTFLVKFTKRVNIRNLSLFLAGALSLEFHF